ncbi:hypothetical protein HN011_005785 [Eciton burchellii]|nr:hypothetical protein HN011_005785 [Eciton burchellii]
MFALISIIIISGLWRAEDFNFRPRSSLSLSSGSRSPLSSGTDIVVDRRADRQVESLSYLYGDNKDGNGGLKGPKIRWKDETENDQDDNGDQTSARVELVRNNHIDRALRMEAGERFESSWSSKPVQAPASPCLTSSLVIPSTFAGLR